MGPRRPGVNHVPAVFLPRGQRNHPGQPSHTPAEGHGDFGRMGVGRRVLGGAGRGRVDVDMDVSWEELDFILRFSSLNIFFVLQ